jgi:hypothetical protein
VEPTEEIAHHAVFFGAGGEWFSVDEAGDEDGGVIEPGDGGVCGESFSGVVLVFEEFQDCGIAFDGGFRASGWEDAGDPGVAIADVDTEDVIVVLAGFGGGGDFDVVLVLEMGDEVIGDGFVEESVLEALEVGEGFGVVLTGFLGVAADDFLETAVLGHGTSLP